MEDASQRSGAGESAPLRGKAPMGAKRVICIDDDLRVLEAYGIMLGDPCQVFLASSPTEGLELVARHRPDLVILDLLMPGMRGDELVARIRQTHPGARLIVVTATLPEHDEQRLQRLREMGADWVFLKPFDVFRFLLVVSNLLGIPLDNFLRPPSVA